MKKAISVICIVLLLLQVILPQMSYAEEIIKDNTVQNEEENKNESNGDESSKESINYMPYSYYPIFNFYI